MKKVLLVGSVASMIINFNSRNIKLLHSLGLEVHVAANFSEVDPISEEKRNQIRDFFKTNDVTCFPIDFPRGVGTVRKNFSIIRQLMELIQENEYTFIHTNSPLASVLVRIAARKTKTKVLYTAHGFQFHKKGPVKDWLIFYPVEKLLAKWTEATITINQEDYQTASKMRCKKNYYLPGVGIDLETINKAKGYDRERVLQEFTTRGPCSRLILISVGELNHNKNHICVIEAIKRMPEKYRPLYLICGIGEKQEKYRSYIEENQLENSVKLLGYRTDIISLVKACDLFVFPSFREGLSVSVMEAMACGKAVFASDVRGNRDLIENHKGGRLFDPSHPTKLKDLLIRYTKNKSEDLQKFGTFNKQKIKFFDQKIVDQKMDEIYRDLLMK